MYTFIFLCPFVILKFDQYWWILAPLPTIVLEMWCVYLGKLKDIKNQKSCMTVTHVFIPVDFDKHDDIVVL